MLGLEEEFAIAIPDDAPIANTIDVGEDMGVQKTSGGPNQHTVQEIANYIDRRLAEG